MTQVSDGYVVLLGLLACRELEVQKHCPSHNPRYQACTPLGRLDLLRLFAETEGRSKAETQKRMSTQTAALESCIQNIQHDYTSMETGEQSQNETSFF